MKHKNKIITGAALLIAGIMILYFSVNVFGKYVSMEHSKSSGVASAANVYFGSNYLTEYPKAESNQPTSLTERHNLTGWNGNGKYQFQIELRNYANRLQYNDSDIDVEYEVYFQLEKNTTDYTYLVSYNVPVGNTTELRTQEIKWSGNTEAYDDVSVSGNETDGQIVKITGQRIDGGLADNNTVNVSVTCNLSDVTGQQQRIADGIKMWVKPIAPNYVTDKADFYLGANLVAVSSSTGFSAEGAFSIMNNSNIQPEESKLLKQSGFNYVIRTSGGLDSEEYSIQLTYDKSMLTLGYFDRKDLGDKVTESVSEQDENMVTLTFNVKTESSYQLNFYKTENFDTNISGKTFSNLVRVSK